MKRYRADGFRTVKANDMKEAAGIFADRIARKKGKRHLVRHVRLNSWSSDGTMGEYQAFIGVYDKKEKTTSGNNELIIVRLA